MEMTNLPNSKSSSSPHLTSKTLKGLELALHLLLDDLSEIEKYFLDKVDYEQVEGQWRSNREADMYDKSLYIHQRLVELIRVVNQG
jgi:hypothetical protein